MTIDLATNSPVFLGYAIITGALLLLAGLLLGLLRLSGRDVSSPLRTSTARSKPRRRALPLVSLCVPAL